MSELRTLKQKRARAKGNITRMRDRVQSEEGISKYEAEARQLKLEELWKQFEDLQLEIEMRMQPSEDRTQEQIDLINYAEREIVETVYYEAAAKIREIVEMAQNRNEQERQVPVVVAAEPRAEEHNVKLPILKIPEFRGDYDQWLTFKGLFKSMFHENRKLTSVQKFQYLKSSLQGEALQIIGGFEISSENYEPAWELLTSTYDNKRLLINTHMNRLLTFPTVEKGKYATIKQIIIHVRTHIKALNVLELPVEHWDELLIHLIKDKLDYVTQKNWEEETSRRAEENRPTLEDFLRFLSEYARTMELIDNGRSKSETAKQLTSNARMIKMEKRVNVATTSRETCDNCSGPHRLFKCEEFLKLSIPMRADKARQLRLCLNCFGKRHFSKECYSGACKKCGAKHNTLLHREESSAKANESKKTSQGTSDASALTVTVYTEQNSDQRIQDKTSTENKFNIHIAKSEQSHVILSTAQVLIEDINGERHLCRALLDPGAQTNVITRSLFNKMRLRTIKTSQVISGINGERVKYTELARVKIKSVHTKFETEIECVIMPTIIEQLPQVKLDKKLIPIAKDMQLADPEFHEPNNIDLLIGAGLFWRIFCRETMPQQTGVPSLQKTLFGWIIGGELQVGKVTRTEKVCGILADVTLKEQLERFWKVEEISEIRQPTEEEAECEENFKKTVERTSSGRFIVSLPRKQNVCLGESKEQAERRLLAVERKFKNDSNCKEEYIKFMSDYESKEHMSRILASTEEPEEICWLPHQAVFKTDGLTTKIRVVFDASSKTSNGQSLNDKLQAGPNLQNEMFDILLRFRTHQFVFSADIEAMYRQILVTERDRHLQRILWRSESTQPMQAYSLNTVTYGTTAAPFLAIRCLRELAQQEDDLLEAANVVRHDFYMDDVLSGAATEEKAIQLRKEVTEVLKKGQFRLRKWRANHKKILEDIKEEDENDKFLKLDKEGALKILGLLWDATTDTIQYAVNIPGPATVTRRSIVSQVAQIFDPLGLLGPILIRGKCIMQQTWQIPIGWDEPLPKIIQEQWQEFYNALQELNEFKVMRNLNPGNQSQVFDIMGFGDASEKAYGACLYAVSKNKEGNTQSFLICSRSKIAPLKTISLPRLELNAALILAKLTATAIRAFGNRIKEIHLWSDSSIVLHQINTSPNLLKTYAANRVTKIQQAVKKATWHHVPSSDNPADVLSRGSSIEEWKHSKLWWHSPWWIDNPKEWPQLPQQEEETKRLELKKALAAVNIQSHEDILGRFSSYDKLLRVSAYCLRFKNNCKQPRAKIIGPLTVQELNQAESVIIRLAQAKSFLTEISTLVKGLSIPKTSKLAAFNPFLDHEGILRIGGRLHNAQLAAEQKHPILIPPGDPLTVLIIRREHERQLHSGTNQLLYTIRRRFWIIRGRREIKKVIRGCIKCFRLKPESKDVLMGDLPKERVCENLRAFINVGTDYAGPFLIRESRRRGKMVTKKAWIAVFVCCATKAVHLELVTDLSTEAFIAALRRFTARRGLCNQILSDNGTNFVGAARQLQELYTFLQKENEAISQHLAQQRIQWQFMPPRSPNFGGLWEAAVKVVKKHFYAVTQGQILTFEEFYSILTEIEAIMNSRPLCPMTEDPEDLAVLTPAHFLVGDSLLLPVEDNFLDTPDNKLSRWQLLQKLRQSIWNRWHIEYLQELQRRHKWAHPSDNLYPGLLVLLKEKNVPPLHWTIARITEVHHGKDEVVRVVTVRTAKGFFKRAARDVCPLPIYDNQEKM